MLTPWDHGGNLEAEELDIDRAFCEIKLLKQRKVSGERISPITEKHAFERLVIETEDFQDKRIMTLEERANAYILEHTNNYQIH
jgi:hypothetical protein